MQQPIEDVICVTTMYCGILDKITVFLKGKDDAICELEARTAERKARGVEGTSQA